ncbi:VWA domain-containing protein [Agromyces sp. MMS24-JH15]|uniref:VWA domain-containing protein n=1 Tax=Agromyces sp. MMS24-JH15 TaxID=3243765 RepID=UPI003749B3F9
MGAPQHADAPVPLDDEARAAWAAALGLWRVEMHEPELRPGAGAERGAAAWFGFPPAITVDPVQLAADGIGDELESVFAHELGHHVLAPSTRIDSLKIRHQMGRALVASGGGEDAGRQAYLANLWSDLLVNARVAELQRRAGSGTGEPGLVRMMRRMSQQSFDAPDRLWWVYRRTYELLWRRPPGTMCPPEPPELPAREAAPTGAGGIIDVTKVPERFADRERELQEARAAADRIEDRLIELAMTRPELDATLIAETVRSFALDPVSGALRFGMVAAPYLVELDRLLGRAAQPGSFGIGVCDGDEGEASADETGRILADRRLHERPVDPREAAARGGASGGPATGQGYGTADTRGLYDASAVAELVERYRLDAARWVRPFTQRREARPSIELPGPAEVWEVGDDLADLDWPSTMQGGTTPIPGVTTRRRSWIEGDPEPVETALDLDLYIDSSGSMPNPVTGSPAVLAGTILALSVLRGGGRVRVTSFSGPSQVAGTGWFLRDPKPVIEGLATFFAGGTSFPLDLYGARYAQLPQLRDGERRHVVVLSDEGLDSMFGRWNAGFEHVAADVRTKLTSGTLLLLDPRHHVESIAAAAGYDVIYLESMDDAPAACVRLAEVLHG